MAERHPSAERVREAFHYEPETGLLTWRTRPAYCITIGAVAGTINKTDGYVKVQLDRQLHYAHVLAWIWTTGKPPPAEQIDHRNGIRSDNRWTNLRPATRSQNAQNVSTARSTNKTGLLGVHKIKGYDRYRATIHLDGRAIDLGYFPTAELGHEAYLAAKARLHPFAER